ncbi:glycine betaine ABC transporter substrate-binding protein [Virgibacillus litoralis]|uniref:Glycine betaine/proline transport system substrate-binding protein n=1 Tax=Virgibacillus litoralis TaxID=578221 RepID=A0ABS4HEI5_9BACI|nr:glycine betaine ABC transporter substrate-binding protein [Virgibacillus litoralis]MBP1949332.1 glycine betaine/proline transport system substrate-binding protein [Virgibacillus litoralis]
MFNFKWKKLGIITGLSLSLVAAGCGEENEGGNEQAESGTSVSKEMEYTITGIEPGAGQTETNKKAIAAYDSLAGWKQETASSAAMLTALGNAIDNQEPIVVAAWSPHYKFAKWDLKYLEDPKGTFGEKEYITTIARKGLKDDMPKAYKILDRIYWELPAMESALLQAQKMEFDFEKVAKQWVDENQETVAKWTKDVEPVDGKQIKLASTSWDTELFSANVAKIVLQEQGYEVNLTQIDPAILFEAIASGDADASLSPWMPTTHGAFYEEYEGQFEDLGANLEGAKIGLAVPTYMDIDSIEDLKPAE